MDSQFTPSLVRLNIASGQPLSCMDIKEYHDQLKVNNITCLVKY